MASNQKNIVKATVKTTIVRANAYVRGAKGDKGDTGVGLPIGGTAGQVIVKNSSTNYDFGYQTIQLPIDATTTNKGLVQLAGDLGGTALQPRVKSRQSITVGTNADYNFSDYASPQVAIQAAINSNTSSGANIVINASYTLTSSVIVKSNVQIQHAHKNVICTFNSGHVNGTPVSPNAGFHAYMTSATANNFSLSNMSFNGGLTTLITGVDGAEYHAIYIKNSSNNFSITDIYGTRVASGVVRFRDNCSQFTVQNIYAYQADAAVVCTVGCNDFTMKNIRAEQTFAEGLYLGSGIYNFNIDTVYTDTTVTRGLSINNDATPDIRAGVKGNINNVIALNSTLEGVYLVGCDELTLTNIYTRNNGRDGVLIYGCNNIVVSANQNWNNNRQRVTDSTSTYAGIRMYDSKYVNITSSINDDDGTTKYQNRGIDSAQSTAGATDYIRVTGGRSENTVSASQAVIIGNNSTVVNHGGYNPRRYSDRGNVGATPSVLLKNGDTQRLVLTANATLQSFDTNAIPGQKLTLVFAQNATGGYTVTFPSNTVLQNGAFVMPTAANATSTITFEYISSTLGWYEVSRSNPNTPVNDATTISKGVVQLAGDLGGTAASPMVNARTATITIGTVGTNSDYVCDGVNDHVEIQAVFDAIRTAGGGSIWMRRGVYNLAATLKIGSNTTLIGEDIGSTILRMGAGQNKTVMQNYNNVTGGDSFIKIQNIRVDQQGTTQTSGGGLSFSGITDSTFQDIYIDFVRNHNFFVTALAGTQLTGTLNVTNGSQTVTGSGTAFTTELVAGSVLRIRLTSNFDEFLRVLSVESDTSLTLDRAWGWTTETAKTFKLVPKNSRNIVNRVTMAGNFQDDNSGFGVFDDSEIINCVSFNAEGYGFGPDHSNNIRVIGNVAYNNKNAGLGLETLGYSTVTANTLYKNGTGIALLSGGYRNTISNNISRENTNYGISVPYNTTAFPPSVGNTITGNQTFKNGIDGIRIGGVSRMTLTGNHSFNNARAGIVLAVDSSVVPTNTLINGNQLYDTQVTKTQQYGIWIANGTNTSIINNHALDADHTTKGILDAGTGTTIVQPLNGNYGINNINPGNKLTINTPSTADTLAQGMLYTGVSTNKGMVIQAVNGQSAPLLELQSSAGNAFYQMTSGGLNRGPAASATAPTYSFTVDGATGFYRPSGVANTVRVSTNGVDRWQWNNTTNMSYSPLDMSSNLINNVTDPTSAQDAATKNYVDTNTSNKKQVMVQQPTQTASFTAVPGRFYPVNASSGNVTVTLPTSATAGQEIQIKKLDSSAASGATSGIVNVTGTINGNSGATVPLRKQGMGKQYLSDGSGGWTIVLGDLDITQLGASTIEQGFVQLAGDLAGTATAPTVPSLATKENLTNKSTSTTLGTSDTLYPTQNAVKTYVDTADSLKANDADVLHKAGAETASGAKTFTSTATFSPTSGDAVSVNSPSGINPVVRIRENGVERGAVFGTTGSNDITVRAQSALRLISDNSTTANSLVWSGNVLTLPDASNLSLNATTGTKIGTSTNQKLGLWNANPVVQPSATTEIGTVLSSIGARAVGTAYPITTSGAVSLTGSITLGSAGKFEPVQSRTATSTVLTNSSSYINLMNPTAAATVSLPQAPANGLVFYLKNISAFTVTVSVATSGTIDGNPSFVISASGNKYAEFFYGGTSGVWYIKYNN